MKIPIASIKLKKRIRKDTGDISTLAASMQRYGQLHPLIITEKFVLVSGYRRLLAAKSLGWDAVEVMIVKNMDKINQLELELDENLYRKALTEDEVHDAFVRLDKLRNPGIFSKIWAAIINFFKSIFKKM